MLISEQLQWNPRRHEVQRDLLAVSPVQIKPACMTLHAQPMRARSGGPNLALKGPLIVLQASLSWSPDRFDRGMPLVVNRRYQTSCT